MRSTVNKFMLELADLFGFHVFYASELVMWMGRMVWPVDGLFDVPEDSWCFICLKNAYVIVAIVSR